ncbi:hypothetical protein TSUD_262740 [Trifolium subterraneum]|nr:hypothetical protein TSUD_262740 [Trifolium subterraneum]
MAYTQKMEQLTFTKNLPTRKRQEIGKHVALFSGMALLTFSAIAPGGSPLTRICQVIVATFKKHGLRVPDDKSLLYETSDAESNIKGSRKLEHTDELKCFDKAAVETESDRIKNVPNPWSLCTVTQVEELKSVIRLLPVWASLIAFATATQWINTLALNSKFHRHPSPFSTP